MSSTVMPTRTTATRSIHGEKRLHTVGWFLQALRVVFIVLLLLFALFPIVWVISASFNPQGSMSSQTLIPQNVESVSELFRNYNRLFNDPQVPFWRWVGNSLFISGLTALIIVLIAALSAYAFSRFRFRFRRNLLLGIFLVQVFPNVLAMVAIYLMVLQLGKYVPALGLNTYGGLIMIYIGGGMALNIWLMKGFFDTVPREIDESAMVDGATTSQIYWQLIFPLVRPVLAVVALLSFSGTLGDFLLARVLITDRENWTLMVGLYSFVEGRFSDDWGVFAAGALLAAVPIVALYLFLQRYIVSGLTAGAVKG
ncbi:MAG: sugar ABC transporter permease [Chloroflexota bacterium]|nr:sugar ABC transporter permease [Chloroflexota bacterium]